MIRFFAKRDILSRLITTAHCCLNDHFLFDEKIRYRRWNTRNNCTAREILFDGYLMESNFAVQKDTLIRFSPTNEKDRNLGWFRSFISPPSGYTAVQWFGETLVDVSHLGKTFFPPFLFDGKSCVTGTIAGIPCAAREILFDGYLMARLNWLSRCPDFFASASLPKLICQFFDFSADSSLSFRLSSTH